MPVERYNIVFAGELLGNASADTARQKLQVFFKLDDTRAAQLFSGRAITVKRDVDLDTAARYQDAFRAAGARAIIETAGDAVDEPEPSREDEAVPPSGQWGLAPPGALLEELEDKRPVVSPDTSGLALVAGDNWSLEDCEPLPATRPAPRTDHLTLAPASAGRKGSD